jgi:hypothetical protein
MIITIEDAQTELAAMIEDAVADSGCLPDEIAQDMLVACCFSIADDDVARELCRMEVGHVPYELRPRLGETDWIDS